MTVNNFYAACFKNATLARNEAGTEQAFETRQLLRLRRALKILVSVVRFRPWPPFFFISLSPCSKYFSSGRSGTTELSFDGRKFYA